VKRLIERRKINSEHMVYPAVTVPALSIDCLYLTNKNRRDLFRDVVR
jgi:hypothetical protein